MNMQVLFNNHYVFWGRSVWGRRAFVTKELPPPSFWEGFRNYLKLLPIPSYPSLSLEDSTPRGTPTANANILHTMFTRQNTQRSSRHLDISVYVPHDIITCCFKWSPEWPPKDRGPPIRDGPAGGPQKPDAILYDGSRHTPYTNMMQ